MTRSVSEEEFREFVDRASESDMIEDNEAELIQTRLRPRATPWCAR